ncbi:MAG: glutamate synthase, partial [Proteobacteria bacterium]|nr:glutamate synthase [Pseudomonadota bacterium]
RMCHTNLCPAGIATQKPELRARLDVAHAGLRLQRFLEASVSLMQVMARACGHDDLQRFHAGDLTTWKRDMADLADIRFAGIGLTP